MTDNCDNITANQITQIPHSLKPSFELWCQNNNDLFPVIATSKSKFEHFMLALPNNTEFKLKVLRGYVFENLSLFPNVSGREMNRCLDKLMTEIEQNDSSSESDDPSNFNFSIV
jgi:hypothetical protein